jgi:hypothetical protein
MDEPPAVWSYPLLCLLWRLGWGGRRLVDRTTSGGLDRMLHALAHGIESQAGAAPDPSGDREPAAVMIAPHVAVEHDVDSPEGVATTLDRITTLLHRSPLAELITASDPAATVINATARLIRPEPPVGHDIAVPPFWRHALAAWPDGHEPR